MISKLIFLLSIWFVVSFWAQADEVRKEQCDFCRNAFVGCYCEGTTDDYAIVCNKPKQDFWSLSFCSAKSIKLSWTYPEQPAGITEFPQLPYVRNLHLIGLQDITLNISKIDYLEQLVIDNPATTNFPILSYPAKVDELVIVSDKELLFPNESFESLKSVSKISFKGHGISSFPFGALYSWFSSSPKKPKVLCSVVDTKIESVPRLKGKYDVEADVPVEDLRWWDFAISKLFNTPSKYVTTPKERSNSDKTVPSKPHRKLMLPVSSWPDDCDPQSMLDIDSSTPTIPKHNVIGFDSDTAQKCEQEEIAILKNGKAEELFEFEQSSTSTSSCDILVNETLANNPKCRQTEFETKTEFECHQQLDRTGNTINEARNSTEKHCDKIQDEVVHLRESDCVENLIPGDETSEPYQDMSLTIANCDAGVAAPKHLTPALQKNDVTKSTVCSIETITSKKDIASTSDEYDLGPSLDVDILENYQRVKQGERILCNSDMEKFLVRPEPQRSSLSTEKLSHSDNDFFGLGDECNLNDENCLKSTKNPKSSTCDSKVVDDFVNENDNENEEPAEFESNPPKRSNLDNGHPSKYGRSSTLSQEPEDNVSTHQIGPELPNSASNGAANAPVIIMVIFGTCCLTFAAIIVCLRRRPRKALLVPSTVDEGWSRSRADPGITH